MRFDRRPGSIRRFGVLAALGAVAALGLAGCSSEKLPPGRPIPIEAEVIQVDARGKTLMIKHGDIPDFMPAMTMGYPVASPRELEGLAPGDTISAVLVVSDDHARLEKIAKIQKPASSVATPAR